MSLKNTPLTDNHIALGARMAEFAGYNMPISYDSIIEEHMAVRNSVGLFDVSHMGEFIVRGKQALDLVQSVISNDASTLEPGHAQYAYLPNDEGGIVDDLLVYRLFDDQCAEGEQAFMLVVNASNIDKDWAWINSKNVFDTRMINISEKTALLALQGPKAIDVLQTLVKEDLSKIKYYHFIKSSVGEFDNAVISATGYTGSGGFELYASSDNALAMWNALIEAGQKYSIKPCGLAARDTLRLEKGYCLYGNDINDEISPLEAGLGWVTKLNKGASFPSKQKLVDQKATGINKKLVGFMLDERRVPRHDYEIFDDAEQKIGIVTSGTMSPTLDKPIGLGYVPLSHAKEGTTIHISFGKKMLPATVCKVPFC
jgi:aminomethyltransferase